MNTLTRRRVLHTAWATPVVAAVTAAPAFATSPPPIHIVSYGESCKYPGQSVPGKEFGYHMVVVFSATTAGTVTINNFVIGGAPTTDITPKTFNVGSGNTTVTFDVFSSNSAQRDATITYTFTPAGGVGTAYAESIQFTGFPPC